jgi:GrpB-like predicted nucleotidyltransferase (UPF0157 family)/REP element-mobilizing transposase RayT
MSKYRIYDQQGLNYLTLTIAGWIDLFTRQRYRDIVIESLKYCRQQKGLHIYAYVIMSNHLHLVAQTEGHELSHVLRDFKKFTANQIPLVQVFPLSTKAFPRMLVKVSEPQVPGTLTSMRGRSPVNKEETCTRSFKKIKALTTPRPCDKQDLMLLQKHQPRWATDFNRIKKVIVEHLQIPGTGVEHIGSTAIQGLAAKPIIDIDLVYQHPASFEAVKAGLEELGYYHNGNQGIAGREVFKREKQQRNHPVLDFIDHHLYACQADGEELQRHLLFRDFLRANEKERKEYESMKYKIAAMARQDRKAYAELKEAMARDFVEEVMLKAKAEKR